MKVLVLVDYAARREKKEEKRKKKEKHRKPCIEDGIRTVRLLEWMLALGTVDMGAKLVRSEAL